MAELNLKPVGVDGLPEIMELSKKIWLPAFSPFFSPTELRSLYNGMYTIDKLSEQLSKPGYSMYIINNGETSIGYCATDVHDGEFWIDKIYVDSALQGNGLGTSVMAVMETLAKNLQIKVMKLRVNRRNESAIAFYKKKGFDIAASVDYPGPEGFVYDDYIMIKDI